MCRWGVLTASSAVPGCCAESRWDSSVRLSCFSRQRKASDELFTAQVKGDETGAGVETEEGNTAMSEKYKCMN